MDKDELFNKIMDKISIVVKQTLDETLTTFPLDKVENYIHKIENELNIIIKSEFKNDVPNSLKNTTQFDDKQLDIIKRDYSDFTEEEKIKLSDKLQLIGFKYLISYKDNYEVEHMFYTPNMQNTIDLFKFNDMKYLYHICPNYVVDKIQKNGFTPKAKNSVFIYDPRIHFVYGFVGIDILRMLAYELDMKNTSKGNKHEYSVIKIKIPETIKFYKDFEYNYGVYTKENIDPSYIVDIKTLPNMSFNEYFKNIASNQYVNNLYR